jgi:hypothetical protein
VGVGVRVGLEAEEIGSGVRKVGGLIGSLRLCLAGQPWSRGWGFSIHLRALMQRDAQLLPDKSRLCLDCNNDVGPGQGPRERPWEKCLVAKEKRKGFGGARWGYLQVWPFYSEVLFCSSEQPTSQQHLPASLTGRGLTIG